MNPQSNLQKEYSNDDLPEDFEEDFDDERDSDEDFDLENAMDECGQMADGTCTLVGTEHCDWDCPFSRQMHDNINYKRDSKGRFSK